MMAQITKSNEYTGSKSGALVQDLIEENKFLLKLVDTIPAKLYFDHDVKEKITSEKHMTMDKKAEGLKRGFNGQIELSSKSKHKRAKLDPQFQKTVSQIHGEIGMKEKSKSKKNGGLLSSPLITRAANIEELQNRLHQRIKELQIKRNACTNSNSKKRLLKREKAIKKKVATVKVNEVDMQTNKALPKAKKEKVQPLPKYNSEGNIMYSKLDFSGEDKQDSKSPYEGKNSKQLLKKAEKKKEKMEKLKSVDPEKALCVEEKEKWKNAILRLENVKVKDDPQLLKKSIKRKEKMKEKKAKAWKERIEQTENKQKARQEKRTKNIKKRKDDKLKSKIKHAKKRGRIITGL